MEIIASGKYEGGPFLLAQDLSPFRVGRAKAYPRSVGDRSWPFACGGPAQVAASGGYQKAGRSVKGRL